MGQTYWLSTKDAPLCEHRSVSAGSGEAEVGQRAAWSDGPYRADVVPEAKDKTPTLAPSSVMQDPVH